MSVNGVQARLLVHVGPSIMQIMQIIDHADHALCGSGREHHMACSTRTELLGNDEDAVAVLQDGGLAGKGSGVTVCVRRRDERYKWEIGWARLLQGM